MQVGRVGARGGMSGLYGTSFLWHDPDYNIDQPNPYFRVQKSLDTTLPYQEHIEPDLPKDPYRAQETGYDRAFAQMQRGLEGAGFLNGRVDANAFSNAVQVQAALNRPQQTIDPARAAATSSVQASDRTQTYIAPPPQVKPKGASQTSGDKEAAEAQKQQPGSSAVNDVMSMIGGAVTTAASAAVQAHSLEVIASQAVQSAASIPAVASTAAAASGQALNAFDRQAAEEALQRSNQPQRAFSAPTSGSDDAAVAPVDPAHRGDKG